MNPTRPQGALSASESRIRLAGTETRWLALEGSGPPLLLLHGYADSADTWRPLMARLAERDRACAAIDLTGFGTASPLRAARPMLPQWDDLVGAAIERLREAAGGSDVIVVGNSLGGCLALRAAEHDDLPIGGIVPIAPAGLHMARWFPVIEGERLIRLLRRSPVIEGERLIRLLRRSPVPVPEVVVRGVVGRVYRSLAFRDPAGADADVVGTFSGHLGSMDRAMAVLDVGRRLLPELADPFDLARIDCPLLLIWGEQDEMVYTTGAERVLRAVDYSDIEVIAECGHCPQVEAPDRLAELLVGFPDSLEG